MKGTLAAATGAWASLGLPAMEPAGETGWVIAADGRPYWEVIVPQWSRPMVDR